MEQYFGALRVYDNVSKVYTASMYLIDNAMSWQRCMCEEGRCDEGTITTQNKFVVQFKQQFFLKYVKDEAQAKLHCRAYKHEICNYVKEFTELMLEIPNMGEVNAFFTFIDNLKLWTKLELQ